MLEAFNWYRDVLDMTNAGAMFSVRLCCFLAGVEERLEIYEQAVKLGGGGEALLGFVEGSLRRGRANSGSVFAAARRSVPE
jgi:hypothetical protein